MKILVIGSGGREHALCSVFSRSGSRPELFCANGNGGIATIARCVPIRPDDIAGLSDLASANGIDLTFVGGETSLAMGVVDEFHKRGLRIIGPGREAARLESSKAFAKEFMARHGIPTAKYTVSHTADIAIDELESGDFGDAAAPVVVKADGLAAGKGVVVAADRSEAVAAVRNLSQIAGSAAAEKIILEECLIGTEVSLLMFVNGEDFALMPAARDHKRLGDGDIGPNTGGMGTITDASLLNQQQLSMIVDSIARPTLRGCVREGFPFKGVLFLGLMMTTAGPKLFEYNVRFGDPEAQSILVRLQTDLVDICEAMLGDMPLANLDIRWRPGSSACVVLASRGYPEKPQAGDRIAGLAQAAAVPGVQIFHAGTALLPAEDTHAAPAFLTAGGRVLGVTAVGDDLQESLGAAYKAAAMISFDGMQFRHDIGRSAGAPS